MGVLPCPPRRRPSLRDDPLWRAPLVPVALAATAGVALDRYVGLPLPISLIVALGGLVAWAAALFGRRSGLAMVYLWLTAAALMSAYHRLHREWFAADDIGNFATSEPRPAHLRGFLADEPVLHGQPPPDSLYTLPPGDTTIAVVAVTQMQGEDRWLRASGRTRLIVEGCMDQLHAGDEVDVVGRLSAPSPPANPGEPDRASQLRDQRICAVLTVHKTSDGVARLGTGGTWSPRAWLAALRGYCRRTLEEVMPDGQERGLAIALLLGDGSALPEADWDRYKRTGVVHVLVVSGQQLTVLGWFLWFVLRRLGLRARTGAMVVALVLGVYAVMVGGAPPAMRAAALAGAACGALLLRRRVMIANSFALAWLVVGLLNPTDWCTPGCQLVVPVRGPGVLVRPARLRPEDDPLARLEEESRPAWQRKVRAFGRSVAATYLLSLAIWLAAAPLVATRYNTVSPIAVLILAPLMVLAGVALVLGFLLLLASRRSAFPWLSGSAG